MLQYQTKMRMLSDLVVRHQKNKSTRMLLTTVYSSEMPLCIVRYLQGSSFHHVNSVR